MELLPSYKEFKKNYPLSYTLNSFIESSRRTICDIISGKDPRLLIIVGPCSIHDKISSLDFAKHLQHLIASISNQFFIVMRAYPEKPRTSSGWKGFLYDPHLDGSNDIKTGIMWTRQLLLELAQMQVPVATEFLDPITAFYYDDLVSWGSIGARTSSSQPHRQLASGLQMPIGMKNGVAGNISAAINGVISASYAHVYMGLNENGAPGIIKTKGNPHAHIVLRGGENGSNYDPQTVAEALKRLEHAHLIPRLVVDCSHHNSGKRHEKQPGIFNSVLRQIIEGNTNIRGLMLESHLLGGSQRLITPSNLKYGISITDPCLDWHSTEKLITQSASLLNQNQPQNEFNSSNTSFSCALVN